MLMRNGVLSTASNAVQRISVLILYVYASGVTDGHEYGLATSLIAVCVAIGSLSSISLGQISNRTLSRLKNARTVKKMEAAIFQVSFLISAFVGGVFSLFGQLLIEVVVNETVERQAAYAVSIGLFSLSFSFCLKGYMHAKFKYLILVLSSIASTFLLLVSYAYFYYEGVVLSLLYAYVLMLVSELLVLLAFLIPGLLRNGYLFAVPNKRLVWPVVRLAWLSSLNGMIVMPVNVFLIGLLTTWHGAETAGKYNLLVQVRNAIVFIPNGFASVFLSLMAAKKEALSFFYSVKVMAVVSGIAAFCVLFCVFASGLMAAYEGYQEALVLTAFTAILMAVNINFGQFFIANNRPWIGIMANSIWAILAVALCWGSLSIIGSGIVGFLLSFMLAMAANVAIQFLFVHLIGEKAVNRVVNSGG